MKNKTPCHHAANESKDRNCPNTSQDWWQTTELAGPGPLSPWAYIVSDFQWSLEILEKAKHHPFLKIDEDIGHYPEPDCSNEEKLGFAYNTISKTHEKIRQKISTKTIDLEFVWLWGEFQKGLAIIDMVAPQLSRTEGLKKSIKKRDKEYARAWYALWYDDYRNKTGIKSRKSFDAFFEPLLIEIRSGVRSISERENKDGVITLVNEFTAEPDNLEFFQISESFRQKYFNGKNFETTLAEAKERRHCLPVVGEEYYPLKN